MTRFKLAAFVFLAAVALQAGTRTFDPPRATHAKTYPARETHDDEGISIAIDPFDTPGKAAVFSVNYQEHGYLPVRVIISNDSDRTLMLNDLSVQYITAKRIKLEPATNDDLYRRLTRGPGRPDKPGVQLPIPVPRRPKPAVAPEIVAEIDAAQFVPVPVTAHSTNSGFLFFDISGIDTPEAGAHVYFTGLKMNGKELFYFDIPLEAYLNNRPGK